MLDDDLPRQWSVAADDEGRQARESVRTRYAQLSSMRDVLHDTLNRIDSRDTGDEDYWLETLRDVSDAAVSAQRMRTHLAAYAAAERGYSHAAVAKAARTGRGTIPGWIRRERG